MLKALLMIGMLGAGQAWIMRQTRARRQKVAGGMDALALQNWDDEGGAVAGGSGAQLAPQLPRMGPDLNATRDYPAAGQAG